MDYQTKGKPSGFSVKQAGKINTYCPKAVQGMEIYAASLRVEHRACQQVVQINENRQRHYQSSLLPFFPEKHPCKHKWKNQMHEVMNNSLPFDYKITDFHSFRVV